MCDFLGGFETNAAAGRAKRCPLRVCVCIFSSWHVSDGRTPSLPLSSRYNVCIFAYGQTGSGKTFTMEGPDANPGVNIRALTDMFRIGRDRSDDVTYT